MWGFMISGLVVGLVLVANWAAADVSLVMDPSPPISSTLVFGDFTEGATGALEKYSFTGHARNDGGTTRRLLVRARANGAVVAGSERSFDCAPGSTTAVVYGVTTRHAATVGLEFEPPDGTLTAISGFFQATPAPAQPAPAGTPGTLAWFATVLLVIGAWLSAGDRLANARRKSVR